MNTQRRNTIKEINAAKQSFFHLQNRSLLHNKSSSSKKNRRHFVIHIHSSILDPSSPLKKKFFRNRETSNLSTHDTRASRNSKSLVMSLVKKPYRFTHDTEEENRQSAVGDDRFVRHDTGISNR